MMTHHTQSGLACWVNIQADGTKEWRLNGYLHREDGPAIERLDGHKEWWLHNRLHRVDGPAIEYPSGSKEWRLHGVRHREDGPAYEDAGGTKEWYLNGVALDPLEHFLEVQRMRHHEN